MKTKNALQGDSSYLYSRAAKNDNTVIRAGGAVFGRGDGADFFTVIAGPCAVESEEQIVTVAREVKKAGARVLRGGAWKPRTSPYSFQGLGEEALRFLLTAKKETALPIAVELTNEKYLKFFDDVDIIQIGARNMQNFSLLREVGLSKKPVILKRAASATLDELLLAAEHILSAGNPNVILCERGIRSFDNYTRAALDISLVPYIREITHLPVIVDPSHASGVSRIVPALCKAAAAVDADGIMVEVHPKPETALCDGEQALRLGDFSPLMAELKKYAALTGRMH